MSSFVIEGGYKLSGTIRPQGAKNEALQIISAVLLTSEEVTVSNIGVTLTENGAAVQAMTLYANVLLCAGL